MTIKKIFGPPGTGKTTHLLSIVEELLDSGVSASKIAFTTFTKAGATEALERACVKFSKSCDDFPYFKTLHALAYRYGSKKKVLGYADYKQLSENLNLALTYGQTNADGSVSSNYRGDHIMAMYQLARTKLISLEQSYEEYDNIYNIDFGEVVRFADHYKEYKEFTDKQDFTDMLEGFVERDQGLDIDYLIVDEAQDIKPLEWKMVDLLTKSCDKVWIAGDDDQCIHVWAGSDPTAFMNLEGETEVLSQSYRVPKAVHTVANLTIQRVAERQRKDYLPTAQEGAVFRLQSIRDIDVDKGSWFFLGRNKRMLLEYELFCRESGYLFTTPGQKTKHNLFEAVLYWQELINGAMITGAQAKIIYSHLKERDRIKHGSRKILKDLLDDDQLVDIHELQNSYGLVWHQSWDTAFLSMTNEEKDYISKIEATTGFDAAPRIEINTIHGSKGKEADNVVLMTDMSVRTYDAYQKDPDNEHRVFYVGMTRAIQNLYILDPMTDRHYDI
jgi:DNA helicase-2/ATP-dependent DNA helicase PcrA